MEGSEGLLEGSEGWLEGSEGQLEGSGGQPTGSEGQPAGSEGQPEGGADGRTEFLPILQDFVPCRGRCPATFCDFTTSKRQGKGTADLMMPFGVLFPLLYDKSNTINDTKTKEFWGFLINLSRICGKLLSILHKYIT